MNKQTLIDAIATTGRGGDLERHEFERRAMAQADRLHRIALSILTNEADCEDATQEALVRAWMNLGSLRQPQYFETWLVRILINECKKMLRKRRVRPWVELNDTLPAPDPPDKALWETLKGIDERYRLPLTLHHVEGYTIQEIAGMLRLTQSTVKWRIHQGKQALTARLGEEEKQ